MEELNFIAVDEGTPQGGIMSPTLCNVALNGIEEVIKKANPSIKGIRPGVNVIRYVDDMIITGKTREIARTVTYKHGQPRAQSIHKSRLLLQPRGRHTCAYLPPVVPMPMAVLNES